MFVLGGGACVVLGGLALVGAASATQDPSVAPDPTAANAGNGGPGTKAGGIATGGPTQPTGAAAAPTSTTLTPLGDEDDGDGDGDGQLAANGPAGTAGQGATAQGAAPTSTASPAATGGTKPSGGGTSWFCTASASVRVCGFAGACNFQMVFGNGIANDRFIASQQAKSACEASARAKGASAVCVVQCSPRGG